MKIIKKSSILILFFFNSSVAVAATGSGSYLFPTCRGCSIGAPAAFLYRGLIGNPPRLGPWECRHLGNCMTDMGSFATVRDNPTKTPNQPGIAFDLGILAKIAKVNPYAADELFSVHVDHRDPLLNLLHGRSAFHGYVTYEIVLLMLGKDTDPSADAASRPLPENRYIQLRWAGQAIARNKLIVTFVTEWIDENAEIVSGHIAPSIEVIFSTTAPYRLLSWRAVK